MNLKPLVLLLLAPILKAAPSASYSVDNDIILLGDTVQFTNTSTSSTEWEWDFDNDGNIDSTAQNPIHTFSSAGIYSVSLTAKDAAGAEDSIIVSNQILVAGYGIINADVSSTDFVNGSGSHNSLGQGWYGKNGDNGSVTSINWSSGLTVGTPGVITNTGRSGSATRYGQFFANNLSGSDWALSFDLGGTGSFDQIRLYGGTLAVNPSGAVLTGDNSPPAGDLVDDDGWTSLLFAEGVADTGTVTFNIEEDLSQFNVITIQFRGIGPDVGTTYDNFGFVPKQPLTGVNDSYTVVPAETLTGNLLDNELTATNDPITITSVDGNASNVGSQITLSSGALLTVSENGDFTYDPNGAFDDLAEGAPSIDSFTYDMSNEQGSANATATIQLLNTPSFSLIGDVTVGFNSGSYSAENFAFDFDANDTGQAFDRYEVSTNNEALFSAIPSIDDNGTLTFATATDAQGDTSVIVTGFDDSDILNSSEQSFTVTVLGPDPVAGFSVEKHLTFYGNSLQFTNTSTDALEWEWDFDSDGTHRID